MIRAYVHENPIGYSVDVSVIMHPAEGSLDRQFRILRPGGWEEFDPGALVEEPTLRMDAESARAVLDALTSHFHGAEDSRALRRDYDAERSRADALIGHLGAVARQLATPAGGGLGLPPR